MNEGIGGVSDAITALGIRAKAAVAALGQASTDTKNSALRAAADLLVAAVDHVLAANANDVRCAVAGGTPAAVIDRLRLTEARVEAMATGLRGVAALDDPVGEVVSGWTRPNGLRITKTRVPLGVVAIIYENRPNVTSDAFALCCKSGNVAFLRGSSGAIESNKAIAAVLRRGLECAGLPADALVLVEDTSYEAATTFMQLRGYIDVLIPRGGPALIASILENATVPYVIDGDGNCHLYVDASADLDMALEILVNGKTQRPSVCNALESLLVHETVAAEFLAMAAKKLAIVEFVGDAMTQKILGADRVGAATPEDLPGSFWTSSCPSPWCPRSAQRSPISPPMGPGIPKSSSPATWPTPTGSPVR